MTKSINQPDDRPIGAAMVAGIFAAVGAGMSAVMWGFGINETGAVFIVLWLVIFLVLNIGWRDSLPPPGTKKAPTVPSHTSTSAPSASSKSAPSAPTASAAASSSGTASAAAVPNTPSSMARDDPSRTGHAIPAMSSAPSADPGGATEQKQPEALDGPRAGKADDLKQIKGVGPALERVCNSLGFYHFDQIANWSAEEVAWVDENLEGFKGRVTRDGWVEQAKTLAAGGTTEFSEKVQKGDVY